MKVIFLLLALLCNAEEPKPGFSGDNELPPDPNAELPASTASANREEITCEPSLNGTADNCACLCSRTEGEETCYTFDEVQALGDEDYKSLRFQTKELCAEKNPVLAENADCLEFSDWLVDVPENMDDCLDICPVCNMEALADKLNDRDGRTMRDFVEPQYGCRNQTCRQLIYTTEEDEYGNTLIIESDEVGDEVTDSGVYCDEICLTGDDTLSGDTGCEGVGQLDEFGCFYPCEEDGGAFQSLRAMSSAVTSTRMLKRIIELCSAFNPSLATCSLSAIVTRDDGKGCGCPVCKESCASSGFYDADQDESYKDARSDVDDEIETKRSSTRTSSNDESQSDDTTIYEFSDQYSVVGEKCRKKTCKEVRVLSFFKKADDSVVEGGSGSVSTEKADKCGTSECIAYTNIRTQTTMEDSEDMTQCKEFYQEAITEKVEQYQQIEQKKEEFREKLEKDTEEAEEEKVAYCSGEIEDICPEENTVCAKDSELGILIDLPCPEYAICGNVLNKENEGEGDRFRVVSRGECDEELEDDAEIDECKSDKTSDRLQSFFDKAAMAEEESECSAGSMEIAESKGQAVDVTLCRCFEPEDAEDECSKNFTRCAPIRRFFAPLQELCPSELPEEGCTAEGMFWNIAPPAGTKDEEICEYLSCSEENSTDARCAASSISLGKISRKPEDEDCTISECDDDGNLVDVAYADSEALLTRCGLTDCETDNIYYDVCGVCPRCKITDEELEEANITDAKAVRCKRSAFGNGEDACTQDPLDDDTRDPNEKVRGLCRFRPKVRMCAAKLFEFEQDELYEIINKAAVVVTQYCNDTDYIRASIIEWAYEVAQTIDSEEMSVCEAVAEINITIDLSDTDLNRTAELTTCLNADGELRKNGRSLQKRFLMALRGLLPNKIDEETGEVSNETDSEFVLEVADSYSATAVTYDSSGEQFVVSTGDGGDGDDDSPATTEGDGETDIVTTVATVGPVGAATRYQYQFTFALFIASLIAVIF